MSFITLCCDGYFLVIIFFSVLIGAFVYTVKEGYNEYYFDDELEQAIDIKTNYCHNFIVFNHNSKDLFYTYEIIMEVYGTKYVTKGDDILWSEKIDLGVGTFFLKKDKKQIVNFCYNIEKEFDYAKITINFLDDSQNLFFTVVPKN